MGRQRRLFIRYYLRIAPFTVGPQHRVLVQHSPGSWQFITLGGKDGITPAHDTGPGGVSGTSGGPYGWQLRHSWCMNHSAGPDNGGLVLGHHMFDYFQTDPVSYTHLTLPTTLHECRSRWSPYH